MHAFTQAIHFIVITLLDMFITLILLRFLLQLTRNDFYNSISQAILKLTNPALIPLRRFIPSIKSVDTAGLVLLFSVALVKIIISCLLQYQTFPAIFGLIIWVIGDLISLSLNVFFWAIIIQAIMSWISPAPGHPIYAILYSLTNPLMQPARKYIKPISGLDLSPIAVLLFLQVLIMLIAAPIQRLGIAWSL